jgi:hypothetical protein
VTEHKEHPVLWGLGAMLVVAAAVGVLIGIGALGVTRVLGLSGGGSGSGASAGATMVIPSPSETRSSESESDSPEATKTPEPGQQSSSTAEPKPITLQSAQSAVAPMQQIDLSGSYPGGDGAILQVQRFEGGSWVDFPVTMSVTGDSFDTFILTGHTGVNRIRVIDTTNGDKSNEIKVTVG